MKLLPTLLLIAAAATAGDARAASTEEIAAMRETADSLHSIGRTDSAAIVGAQAIEMAVEAGDPVQIVGARTAQGVFLRSLGRVDEALKSYESALEIVTSGAFRENPGAEATEEIASLYTNLAVLHLDTGHKELAAKNAVLAGEWAERSEDPQLRSTIYGVAGSVLTGCGDLDNAVRYQALAYGDALAAGDTEAAFRAAAYTMMLADRNGKKDEAARWREKCAGMLPEIESMMARLLYYQAECSIALRNNDNRSALGWFDKILNLDGIDNLPFVKFDCYNNMHLAYSQLGDFESAYGTLMASNELRDSLWEAEKAESLRDLTVKYETKETELALAQSEARRAGTLMWLLAAVALLVAAAAGFVVYAGRQRRRRLQKEVEFATLKADTARELTRQYIEGLESERRRMSRELHDGVCNDLLAIQMNMTNGASAEATAGLIDSCRESVRRISHELMPPEFAYASIDEVLRLFVKKQHDAQGGRMNISYSSETDGSPWSTVHDATALEVYRIVQEATGNAIKHSGATAIDVAMTLQNGDLRVSVADNGTHHAAAGKGLGLESMRRRAASIGGSVVIKTHENGGTTVNLTVKL
ncbi:MAG: hypothetical protein K2L21_07775 [Muribaculaceae bacterium]|nr:hypothetical protein [Muribaculaceae bacterium]